MSVNVVKAERVVSTALGLLERMLVVPRLVWRDAAGDFRGAKDDTISIRVPAYTPANKRTLRSGASKDASSLHERKVDVTLTDELYKRIPITSEELTLDVESFEDQLVLPCMRALARGIEDEVVTLMSGATYQNTVTVSSANPHKGVTKARRHLNDANVPFEDRALVVGTGLEEAFLNSDQFVRADQSGSTEALRNANIGRVAGFQVVVAPSLDPDEGYAFHRTAFALNTRAPFVPAGVAWGESRSFEGYAIRVARQVNEETLVENFHSDLYIGTNTVSDVGAVDADGKFEPAEDPEESGASELFVRAVKLELGS